MPPLFKECGSQVQISVPSGRYARGSRALGTLEHQSLVPSTNVGLPTINRTPEDSMPSSGLNGHPHKAPPTRGGI